MKEQLKQKITESLSSVLPITAIVLFLSMTLTPMPAGTLILFILGAVMLIVGMGFFSLGAEISMMPLGKEVGVQLSKSNRLYKILIVCFIIGAAITIAEPDLQVLAKQVPAVDDMIIILSVAVGVGIFLMISLLREYFGISLRTLLIVFYAIVFAVSFFVPKEFLPVAFDSGGVTTGPITVPFIMAFGIGIASAKKNSSEDSSFGLVALCSIGPIITVLIMGLMLNTAQINYTPFEIPQITDSQQVGKHFAAGFPIYIKHVAFGLLPIMLFFAAFQIIFKSSSKKTVIKILVGAVYTYIGLVFFLTGVNVGFMPAGNFIGASLAKLEFNWILIPLGMVVGYFIVIAEPAVHVLNQQVEDIRNGAVPKKAMMLSLSIGVSVSIGLSMLRILTGISIYWLILPGYISALALSFFVPGVFTAIAFDSGGVASGPMTATFLLPFAMGACESLGSDILTNAFGIIAMVAMTPLITIQILGLFYNMKVKSATDIRPEELEYITDDIIDYPDNTADCTKEAKI